MPRTLRELVWAARGKEYAEWERLAVLLCLTANVNRDPKKGRASRPTDFFRRPGVKPSAGGTRLTAEAFRSLKSVFVKKRE